MKVAVLSGKGGTGKTLVSVNLAAVCDSAMYLDCDVEEPNGHLYFKPQIFENTPIVQYVPKVDPVLCTGAECRACANFCKFNALAFYKNQVNVFESVCHACGGCARVCPSGAISENPRPIGVVSAGIAQFGDYPRVSVITGTLNVGEVNGVPIIHNVLSHVNKKASEPVHHIIDCPPGSACSVMESIQDADFCLLVAEPTEFGAHNLGLVHELATLFNKPCGAVLNKCTVGANPSEAYCLEQGIPILGRLPFDFALGALSAGGEIAAYDLRYRSMFEDLWKAVISTESDAVGGGPS